MADDYDDESGSPSDKAGSGNIPVTGAACGIKPDPEAMENSEAIDFSQAKKLLNNSEKNDDL